MYTSNEILDELVHEILDGLLDDPLINPIVLKPLSAPEIVIITGKDDKNFQAFICANSSICSGKIC